MKHTERKTYFTKIKPECSKIALSPLLWNIFLQAKRGARVIITERTPSALRIKFQILLKDQKDLGW